MTSKTSVLHFGSIVFLLCLSVNHAQASCDITTDDGKIYTNVSVLNCADLYATTHLCNTEAAQTGKKCDSMNSLAGVNWSANSDIGIALHRGLWGYKMDDDSSTDKSPFLDLTEDVPQNSTGAFVNAHNAGYKMVEIDVILNYRQNRQIPPSDGNVLVNHYSDLTGMSSYSAGQSDADSPDAVGFLQNTPKFSVISQYLRPNWEREVNRTSDNKLVLLETLFDRFAGAGIDNNIMMIDPIWLRNKTFKEDLRPFNRDPFNVPAKQNAEYMELVKKVLQIAYDKGVLHRIVIKTSQRMGNASKMLALEHADKVLWAPNPDLSDKNQVAAFDYINSWNAKNLGFVEIVANEDIGWYANPFQYCGTNYRDISQYIKLKTNRRTGLWVIDPLTRYGSNSIFYTQASWFGNFSFDRKGEYLWQINKLKHAKQAIITTDRPEIFSRIRKLID